MPERRQQPRRSLSIPRGRRCAEIDRTGETGGEDERDGEAVCHADDDLGDGAFGLGKTLLVIGRHSAGRGRSLEHVSADAGPELQWNK